MRSALAVIVAASIAATLPALAKQSDIRRQKARPAQAAGAAANKPAVPAGRSGRLILPRAQNLSRGKAGRIAPKRDNEHEGAILAALEGGSAVAPANFPDSVGWRLIEDPATGARLGLPEKLVPRLAASRIGNRWSSAQGQIQVETFRLTEATLSALFEDEKKVARRAVAASVLRPELFVMSGIQGLKNFFMRAEARGSEVRGMTVLYDQATEGTMERIALAMLAAYTAFPDPTVPPPAGLRRGVEYGTAIAVTSDGDLLTSAHLTEECRSISVPGLGHGERIAADGGSDLALIRLYGARDLVPMAFTGDGGQSGELRLIGIDDPLVQNGEGAVTSLPAQITGADIQPTPALGFTGAAALDARGVFVGMVDFKPTVAAVAAASATDSKSAAASNASILRGAALVPAETIRTFLQAHGVAPAVSDASHTAVEQSVMRVICVRM
jgi:hypothetical protein